MGIIYWLYKRHRRARRAKALGFASYREFVDPPKLKGPFILPPDPAVLKGQVLPGQKIDVDKKHKTKGKDKKGKKDEDEDEGGGELKHARTVPLTRVEKRELEGELQEGPEPDGVVVYGSTENLRGLGRIEDAESVPVAVVHRASAQARVPSKHGVRNTRSLEHVRKRDTYPPPTDLEDQKPPRENVREDYWYQKRRSA